MPPKTIKCSICGAEVLKSQTYATGQKDADGTPLRACKTHEGVIEKAEQLKKKLPKIDHSQSHMDHFEFREWADRHCWMCEQKGITVQEASAYQLIVLRQLELKGLVPNPLDEKTNKIQHSLFWDLMKEINAKCVFQRFEINSKQHQLFLEWKNRIHYQCRPIAEQGGIIQLCVDCQERSGIIHETKPPDLTLLASLGSAYRESEEYITHTLIAAGLEEKAIKRNAEHN